MKTKLTVLSKKVRYWIAFGLCLAPQLSPASFNEAPLRGNYGTVEGSNELRILALDSEGHKLGEVLFPNHPLRHFFHNGRISWNSMNPGQLIIDQDFLPVHGELFHSPDSVHPETVTLTGRGTHYGAKEVIANSSFAETFGELTHPFDKRCAIRTEAFAKVEVNIPLEAGEIKEGWTYQITGPSPAPQTLGINPCSTSLLQYRESYLSGANEDVLGLGILAVAERPGFISVPMPVWVSDPISKNEYRKIKQIRMEYSHSIQRVR